VITLEWLEGQSETLSEQYRDRIRTRLARDVFPVIGKMPIADIKPIDVLNAVRRLEARDARESAHRALGEVGRVFRYAVATQRAPRDVTSDLRGALKPVKVEHFAAVTEPKAVGELLRAIHDYKGSPQICAALRIAPLVFTRPGELRKMEWKDINLETNEWRYFVNKTKTEHIVPLSKQALVTLKELREVFPYSEYVFPSGRAGSSRPMSENAVLSALRRMGIPKEEMSGHGFRAMARTILDEVLQIRPDYVEHQLAHAVKDANGRAYNRTSHLPERRKMMQQWADYLEGLRDGSIAG
jgi:integrase